MKTRLLPLLCMCLSVILTLSITSCDKDDDNPKATIFTPDAQPFGKSFEEWGIAFWQYNYTLTCEQQNQFTVAELGPQVTTFLGPLGDTTVHITLSKDKALFLPAVTSIFDYPCPHKFEPAPGQSLQDFLAENATASLDMVTVINVTFDGKLIENINDYRIVSDLFYFTGLPELTDCYDPCVTGESQPAVFDGYMLMFDKMSPGQHTINMYGEVPTYSFTWNATIVITVQ